MSKAIELSELSSRIDREIDSNSYEITIANSAIIDPYFRRSFKIYELGNLSAMATVYNARHLITPMLAALCDMNSLFAVGIRNEHREADSTMKLDNFIIGIFANDFCHAYYSGKNFTLRNENEVARIYFYDSGPCYKVSVRGIQIFDIRPHECKFRSTDDSVGVEIDYTDPVGVSKLVRFLNERLDSQLLSSSAVG